MAWNAERIGRLETLYKEGVSFRVIASEFGVTRNAVIGKVHRMQLPKRLEVIGHPTNPTKRTKPPRTAKVIAMNQATNQPDTKTPEPGRDYRCTFFDLNERSCRYPLWEATTPHAERFYCGVPDASFIAGVPYCRHHAALCGVPRRR